MRYQKRKGILDRFRNKVSYENSATHNHTGPETGDYFNPYPSNNRDEFTFQPSEEQFIRDIRKFEYFANIDANNMSREFGHVGYRSFSPEPLINTTSSDLIGPSNEAYSCLHQEEPYILPEGSEVEKFKNRSTYEYNHGGNSPFGSSKHQGLKVTVSYPMSSDNGGLYCRNRNYHSDEFNHSPNFSSSNSQDGYRSEKLPPFKGRKVLCKDGVSYYKNSDYSPGAQSQFLLNCPEEQFGCNYEVDSEYNVPHSHDMTETRQVIYKRGRDYENSFYNQLLRADEYPGDNESLIHEKPLGTPYREKQSEKWPVDSMVDFLESPLSHMNNVKERQRIKRSKKRRRGILRFENDLIHQASDADDSLNTDPINPQRNICNYKARRGILSRMNISSKNIICDKSNQIDFEKKSELEDLAIIERASPCIDELENQPSHSTTTGGLDGQEKDCIESHKCSNELETSTISTQEEPETVVFNKSSEVNDGDYETCNVADHVNSEKLELNTNSSIVDTSERENEEKSQMKSKIEKMENSKSQLLQKLEVLNSEYQNFETSESQLSSSDIPKTADGEERLNEIKKFKLEISIQRKKVRAVLALIQKQLDVSRPINSDEKSSHLVQLEGCESLESTSHICVACNVQFNHLSLYLKHLHSVGHLEKYEVRKASDISIFPEVKNGENKGRSGSEVIIGIQCYYCRVCHEHLTTESEVSSHLYSRVHRSNYEGALRTNQMTINNSNNSSSNNKSREKTSQLSSLKTSDQDLFFIDKVGAIESASIDMNVYSNVETFTDNQTISSQSTNTVPSLQKLAQNCIHLSSSSHSGASELPCRTTAVQSKVSHNVCGQTSLV